MDWLDRDQLAELTGPVGRESVGGPEEFRAGHTLQGVNVSFFFF